jgi:hypothetical protein
MGDDRGRPPAMGAFAVVTPLAITGNGVGRASGSMAGKGDPRLNLQRTEEAR